MANYGSTHKLYSPSFSIHTNMISPSAVGVKIISRIDSMNTGNIWRKTGLELDKTSTKRVTVDASEIKYCDDSGIVCFGG